MTRVLALLLAGALSPACAGDGAVSRKQGRVETDLRGIGCAVVHELGQSTSQAEAGSEETVRIADIRTSVPTGYVVLWDHYLAFTPRNKEAVVCDLATGRLDRVAKTRSAEGHLGWLQGSGENVVFSDYSSLPNLTDEQPGAAWSVHVFNLKTRARRELARSTGGTRERFGFLPTPTVDGRWVAWLQAKAEEPKPTQELVAFDLDAGGIIRVLQTATPPGSAVVSDGRVYFNAEVTPGRLELLTIPADGSGPASIVPTDAKAAMPHVRRGVAVWQQYVPNSPAPPDNQYEVVARLLSEDRIVPVGRGNGPVTSGSLVVWYNEDQGLLAKNPRWPASRPAVVLAAPGTVDFGARWDAFGDIIVWVAIDDPLHRPDDRVIRFVRVIG